MMISIYPLSWQQTLLVWPEVNQDEMKMSTSAVSTRQHVQYHVACSCFLSSADSRNRPRCSYFCMRTVSVHLIYSRQLSGRIPPKTEYLTKQECNFVFWYVIRRMQMRSNKSDSERLYTWYIYFFNHLAGTWAGTHCCWATAAEHSRTESRFVDRKTFRESHIGDDVKQCRRTQAATVDVP